MLKQDVLAYEYDNIIQKKEAVTKPVNPEQAKPPQSRYIQNIMRQHQKRDLEQSAAWEKMESKKIEREGN